MTFLLLLLFSLINPAQAQTEVCDIIDMDSCHGVTRQTRRASSLSLPSPAASATTNPATVSFDRGFGIEVMYQNRNALTFNVASGTGKVGGALISHSMENSFFSNRVPEIDDIYFIRREDYQQYKSKKLNLALGKKIIRKRNVTFDLGLLFKRHSEIKRVNPGLGIAGRLGPITYGVSYYQDDFSLKLDNYINPYSGIPYAIIYSSDTYTERFLVESYMVGTKIKNLALDAGVIRTKYKFYEEDTSVALYSAALFYKNYLFNLAIRNEMSPSLKYEDGILVEERNKSDVYWGFQTSVNKRLILGVNYNFFLLREISFSANIFI